MEIETMVQSDNWWIEGEGAFFCAAEYGALFYVNFVNMQCDFLARIPDCIFYKYRLSSYCMKYKDKVYCFPYQNKYICCYDLGKKIWKILDIGYEDLLMICVNLYKKNDENIWLAELKGKNVFQVNLNRQTVEKIYSVSQNGYRFNGQYVLAQEKLYYIAGNNICCIDTKKDKIKTYDINSGCSKLQTICYDGNNFWLSTNQRKIFVWNIDKGIVKEIKDFPDWYRPGDTADQKIISKIALFGGSVSLGKYVWFFPLQCIMPIIYINKENYQMHILDIEEEFETDESIDKRGNAFKYIFEYVRQERYIGVYSIKNHKIFEIDIVERSVEYKKYFFTENALIKMANEYYKENNLFWEKNEMERIFWTKILKRNIRNTSCFQQDVGKLIFNSLKS